jgi:hypothetical protein
VQSGTFLFQVYFDHFLRVVPRSAGVGHEDRLVQPEDRYRDQVTDEEERFDERLSLAEIQAIATSS